VNPIDYQTLLNRDLYKKKDNRIYSFFNFYYKSIIKKPKTTRHKFTFTLKKDDYLSLLIRLEEPKLPLSSIRKKQLNERIRSSSLSGSPLDTLPETYLTQNTKRLLNHVIEGHQSIITFNKLRIGQ